MSHVVAVIGARRGTERAKEIAAHRERHWAAEQAAVIKKKRDLAEKFLAHYDRDASGGISKAELIPMLEHYGLEIYGKETSPNAEDIEFLFTLCCHEKRANSEIKRNEVLDVIDAWSEFTQSKENLMQLLQKHDADRGGTVDIHELQSILDEIKDQDKLRVVPHEVTQWIFSQADLSSTGVLTDMELARALCAYNVWLGKRTMCPHAPDRMLAGIGKEPAPTAAKQLSDAEWKKFQKTKEEIRSTLLQHDLNGDCQFELHEMVKLLVKLGMPESDASEMHKQMDSNGDSVVSVDEFLNWIFGDTSSASDEVLKTMAPSTKSTCVIS